LSGCQLGCGVHAAVREASRALEQLELHLGDLEMCLVRCCWERWNLSYWE